MKVIPPKCVAYGLHPADPAYGKPFAHLHISAEIMYQEDLEEFISWLGSIHWSDDFPNRTVKQTEEAPVSVADAV